MTERNPDSGVINRSERGRLLVSPTFEIHMLVCVNQAAKAMKRRRDLLSELKLLDPWKAGVATPTLEGALRAVPVLRAAPAVAAVQGFQELAGSTL